MSYWIFIHSLKLAADAIEQIIEFSKWPWYMLSEKYLPIWHRLFH
jgi:hypothetical protein